MTRVIVCTLTLLAFVAVAAGCAVTDDLAQGPPDRDRRSGFSGYGCPELARQVQSASRGDYLEVREITALQVQDDHRATVSPPRGDGHALVLRCSGSALWSWGREPVLLEVSIDRDAVTSLHWAPTS